MKTISIFTFINNCFSKQLQIFQQSTLKCLLCDLSSKAVDDSVLRASEIIFQHKPLDRHILCSLISGVTAEQGTCEKHQCPEPMLKYLSSHSEQTHLSPKDPQMLGTGRLPRDQSTPLISGKQRVRRLLDSAHSSLVGE